MPVLIYKCAICEQAASLRGRLLRVVNSRPHLFSRLGPVAITFIFVGE